METALRTVNAVISALLFICYAYQFLYIPLVLAKRPKPLAAPAGRHRYAVLIAARNEENVISGLLESLRAQTYDMSLVTVFVAADNCTDDTAAIARAHGAVVYERFNQLNVGKGYALDFLLQHIGADDPAGFDGYFVFDADNLLAPDYIERMNEMFSNGHEIITSYRNSKNFGGSWISGGYIGLRWGTVCRAGAVLGNTGLPLCGAFLHPAGAAEPALRAAHSCGAG